VDCFSKVAGSGTPYFTLSGASGINFRRYSGGSNITLNNATAALTMEVVTGGGQTIATAGASVEVRGICRAISLTGIASGATCQIDCVTGPITLAGSSGTVNIYGICSSVTDNRDTTPTLNTYADVHANTETILSGVNVTSLNGSATAAARLSLSTSTIVPGTVSDAVTTPTTAVFAADNITEATANHYIGRVVIFTSGALIYQAAPITDYELVSGEGKFTVSAMTDAPANDDTFIVV
jgi:hypothetical protein